MGESSPSQQPVCAQEALDLLNCVTDSTFDQDKCLRLLQSLRNCVQNKKVKKFTLAEQSEGKIGASFEFLKNGMDVLSAEENEGDTTQQRKRKGTGVTVDISLDDIVRFSVLSIKDASGGLQVSESTLKRVCSEHGIHRWPPQDINKQKGTSKLSHLTWDLRSNQPQDPAFQEMETVTIKAKYLQYTMRFSLCLSLGIQELKQQVAKRLCPGAGNYFFGYEDEDGDLVKIGCDEDLHDCISFSKGRGKNPVPI